MNKILLTMWVSKDPDPKLTEAGINAEREDDWVDGYIRPEEIDYWFRSGVVHKGEWMYNVTRLHTKSGDNIVVRESLEEVTKRLEAV